MQQTELQNFISSLLSQGVKLIPNGDKLKFDGDKEVLSEGVINKIKENKEDILNYLTKDTDQASKPKVKAKKVIRRNGVKIDGKGKQESVEQKPEPERFLETAISELQATESNNLTPIRYAASVIENSIKLRVEEAIIVTPTSEEAPQAYLNGKEKNLVDSCQHHFYELNAKGSVRYCINCQLIERSVVQYAEPRF